MSLAAQLAPVLQRLRGLRGSRRGRQVGESLASSVAIQFLLLLSGTILARALGPAGRGDLAILLLLPALADQLAGLGVPAATTYFIARSPDAAGGIVRRLLPVAALQAAIAAALLVGLGHLFLGGKGSDVWTAVLITVASVPFNLGQYYSMHLLQGLGRIRQFNLVRVTPPALMAVGYAAGALLGDLDIVSCALIWAGSNLVVTLAAAVMVLRAIRADARGRTGEADVPGRREMVRFGAAGFLAQVSPVETFRVDTLVVAGLFSSSVVGYYAVALSLSNAPRFIADGIVAVAYPHVSSQRGREGVATARRYVIAAGVACGGLAVALALAAPLVVPLIFGEDFQPAAALSAILVFGAGLVSVRRVGTDCLRGLGRPVPTTLIEIVTLVALALGFVLIGSWGEGKGVALSLVASATIGLVLTLRSLELLPRPRPAGIRRPLE